MGKYRLSHWCQWIFFLKSLSFHKKRATRPCILFQISYRVPNTLIKYMGIAYATAFIRTFFPGRDNSFSLYPRHPLPIFFQILYLSKVKTTLFNLPIIVGNSRYFPRLSTAWTLNVFTISFLQPNLTHLLNNMKIHVPSLTYLLNLFLNNIKLHILTF